MVLSYSITFSFFDFVVVQLDLNFLFYPVFLYKIVGDADELDFLDRIFFIPFTKAFIFLVGIVNNI